jgi:hypothetical protein
MVPEEGLARLSLAPRAIRCGVPQGAHFVREWGRPAKLLNLTPEEMWRIMGMYGLQLANESIARNVR